MKRSGCLLLLIAALLLALWVEAYSYHVHLSLPLPNLNLRAIPALAASLQNDQASARKSESTYTVTSSPSLTASFINRVLAAYRSPAAGTGQALYSAGVQYGIDPAYALAFFMHESSLGRAGMARTTLSLGNLRCIPGARCYQGYAAFPSWQAGYEAWYKLIRSLYVNVWHKTTVEQIVPTYAPASDHNAPLAYIRAVERAVDAWRAGKVEVSA